MQAVLNNQISIGIVDDSATYRDALVSYFKSIPDINVLFEAVNGVELTKKLKKNHPHVILLDLEMPKMDGKQVLKKLRDKYPSIKFIMLTMHDEESLIHSFLSMGANSYLNKSATPPEIYNAIINCYKNDFYINSIMTDAIFNRIKKQNY